MLAVEHSRRDSLFEQSYALDKTIQPPYPGLDMEMPYGSYDSIPGFHPLPFSYFENPTMFASAPAQSMKPQISRSQSQNSFNQYQQQSTEMPPALISSASNASIPSASSSTVGSPYSGPINTSQAQDTYVDDALSHGLGLLPTIVNQDGFRQDFAGSGFESELPMGHDKIMSGNFVGECADLSYSFKRSPTLPVAMRQSSQSVFSATPVSASSPRIISTQHELEAPLNVPALVQTPPVTDVSCSSSLPPSVEPVFKSPSTPASAYPRTPGATSPTNPRQSMHGGQQTSSPQQAPSAPVVAHGPSPMLQYGGQYQGHFFAQSSGTYMPPLETSCSFSLL